MASDGPLVSVLIPTYNRPEFLTHALRSAVNQTYANTEILVQDNASDFDIEALVAEFADSRISLCRNETNVGMALNWRAVALRAKGKYVAFLSDDDVWEEEYLTTLVKELERNENLVLAFCDHWLTDAAGRIDPARTAKNTRRWLRDRIVEGEHKPFTEIALVYRSIWTASATVFRRDAIDWEEIPPEAGIAVDLYLAYLAARTGGGGSYCNKRLARYRVHRGSTTASFATLKARIECAENAMFCWRTFASDRFLTSSWPYFRIKLVHNLFRHGLCRWLQGTPNLGPLSIFRLLAPHLCIWHLFYMVKLRRIRV
ncbi:MAG TPA: glycosyltransferase [Stellaceae bacterium]|nr:glycosyltransferase [Stellaceae bacterium]